LPLYHSDIQGVFEVANRADGDGRCVQAVVSFTKTKTSLDGLTVLGDATWKDYQVSVDATAYDTGSAALLGRVSDTRGKAPKAYILKLAKDGAWSLLAHTNTLATGRATLPNQPWHNLKLRFAGALIESFIDGQPISSVTNTNFPAGMVGLGTHTSAPSFDNLIINTVDGEK